MMARTDATAEVAEVAAAETAAAEAAAAVAAATEAAAPVESAAAAGGTANAAADAPGAEAALAPELPKEPCGGADGIAEDVEEIPERPMSSVEGREKSKTRGGSLSSEGANAAAQAERSTPMKFLRSLQHSNARPVNTLPIAKSQTRSKQNKDMHKYSCVYSERGVLLPVLTSGGE